MKHGMCVFSIGDKLEFQTESHLHGSDAETSHNGNGRQDTNR